MGTVFVDNLEPQSGTSLTLGASGDTLQAASGVTNNLSKVAQIVQGQNATAIGTTSTSDFDIVTASITPTATSSSIIIIGNVMGIENGTGSVNTRLDLKLKRDDTQIMSSGANWWSYDTTVRRSGGFAINFKDDPSSTSSITYKIVGGWLDLGGQTCDVNKDGNSGSSTITLLEVLA